MPLGNRMSSLPVAEFCGGAWRIPNSSGRHAAMSSAFHAKCAGSPDADRLLAMLTDEEREIVAEAHPPADVDGLRYEGAAKEVELLLTADGEFAVFAEDPECISIGHADMAWSRDGVAYVGDIKWSEYTSEVNSLQLLAYGFAYAALMRCDAFATGIWAASEGTWTWGKLVKLDSSEALILWNRVRHAILNRTTEYTKGPHCRGCYGRFQCPAYLLPPETANTSLAIFREGGELTHGNAANLLLLCQQAEDTIKMAKEQLKDFASRNGGIRAGNKVWKGVLTSGKKSLDQKALMVEIPQAAKFMKQGQPYETFRWVNAKEDK